MQTNCRAIETDGRLHSVEESAALSAWRAGQGPFWIDLEAEETGEFVAWLKELGMEAELVDTVGTTDSTGRVLPLDDLVFFEYPVPVPGSRPAAFACVCVDRLLVTMHRRVIQSEKQDVLTSRLRLRESTISTLVCGLVVGHSLRLRRAALALRDGARDLTAAMDENPEAVSLEDILDLKRRILDLDRTADEQMAVFDLLEAMDKPQLDLVDLAEHFRLATANARAADRRLERLDRAADSLHQRYENLQQEKINKRLGVLTILSAIFMPLTLIAGIYGMNFDVMPELHLRYAYPVALGGMAVVAGALYWYFRSRGWLD